MGTGVVMWGKMTVMCEATLYDMYMEYISTDAHGILKLANRSAVFCPEDIFIILTHKHKKISIKTLHHHDNKNGICQQSTTVS